jgi:ribosomal protein L37AE/L43A
MKRQKEATESLVYAYGAEAPVTNEKVQAEVERQRLMWNKLVGADRKYDHHLNTAMRGDPDYVLATAELDRAYDQIREVRDARNRERAKTRQRATSQDEAIKKAYRYRNEIQKHAWAIAKRWRLGHEQEMDALGEERKAENKRIRQTSGLYWGNYNRVMDAFETARKQCRKLGRRVRYKDDCDDSGILAVQIQKVGGKNGASPEQILNGQFAAIRINPVSNAAFALGRTQRTRSVRTEVTLRCDADGSLVRFPIWMHRPLPEGFRAKSAELVWHREGERVVGRLCLTLTTPAASVAHHHEGTAACGVDLGWRLQDDRGLLVATLLDTHGKMQRFALPPKWMSGMDQVERLSAYIDQHLLEIAAWIHDHPELRGELTTPIRRWRPGLGARHADAKALHDAVRALQFEVPRPVLDWYKRYRHLLVWRDNLRAKLIRQRREHYRLWAREIAKAYAIIGMEDMDLSVMARTKKRNNGTDNELHANARAQRVRACAHALRIEIKHQAHKSGTVIRYATKHTTERCGACKKITKQENRSSRVWVCEHCGASWDQDANAAGNLLSVAIGAVDAKKDFPPTKVTNQ